MFVNSEIAQACWSHDCLRNQALRPSCISMMLLHAASPDSARCFSCVLAVCSGADLFGCIQGHSLGGSLGTLLMMMYKYRGVLPQSAIAPVYTFGAPAIFCEGACCNACQGTSLCSADPKAHLSASSVTDTVRDTEADASATAASPHTSATEPTTDTRGHLKSQGILQALGLEAGCVRNIFMSRDIVPRAFACDYTLVADLLRRVGEGFREHDCLMGTDRLMSAPPGTEALLKCLLVLYVLPSLTPVCACTALIAW